MTGPVQNIKYRRNFLAIALKKRQQKLDNIELYISLQARVVLHVLGRLGAAAIVVTITAVLEEF
jgi:hypothetical protein